MNGNIRMISFICEERRYTCSSVRCIVVGEFRERKQFRPIVLLIVAVDSDGLFQGLVGALCLTVGLGMITGSEVKLHVKRCPKGSEKAGNEFRSTVGSDMGVRGLSIFPVPPYALQLPPILWRPFPTSRDYPQLLAIIFICDILSLFIACGLPASPGLVTAAGG